MIDQKALDVQSSYDLVADEYVRRIFDELAHKPLDRELLDQFTARARGRGPVCDLGCGPGHVARYLHARGVPVIGVDLSSAMVERARALNPGIEFNQGDMRAPEFEQGALAGIVAFYSIIHIPKPDIVAVLAEMRRILQPGGALLLAFHIGDEVVHLDEWWGLSVSLDFGFFQTGQMTRFLNEAGFEILQVVEREPYPGVEHPSRRAYVLAENAPCGLNCET